MKKILLHCAVWLMPLFALAQQESLFYKDLAKKTKGIAASFKFNDQMAVYQINLNDTTFKLVAFDNKMQLLWQTECKGYGITAGMYKGHILAISATGIRSNKGVINPFEAILIDEQSGKLLLENKFFDEKAAHAEFATGFFSEDGSDFSLIVRQADVNIGMFSEHDETKVLTIIKLNEKLEPAYNRLQVPEGNFMSLTCNNEGDLYVLTEQGNRIIGLWRYEHGAKIPSLPIVRDYVTLEKADFLNGAYALASSEADSKTAYVALVHDNKNNDRTLTVEKFNFNKRISELTEEIFTGAHIRELEKNFKSVNGDTVTANIGSQKGQLGVRYIKEHQGNLVVALSESFYVFFNKTVTYYDKAIIVNDYDVTLKKKFQQLLPVSHQGGVQLTTAFNLTNDSFSIVTNSGSGSMDNCSVYGRLDLATGNWLKVSCLLNSSKYASDQHVLWLKDNFITPYNEISSSFFSGHLSYSINLQLNKY